MCIQARGAAQTGRLTVQHKCLHATCPPGLCCSQMFIFFSLFLTICRPSLGAQSRCPSLPWVFFSVCMLQLFFFYCATTGHCMSGVKEHVLESSSIIPVEYLCLYALKSKLYLRSRRHTDVLLGKLKSCICFLIRII